MTDGIPEVQSPVASTSDCAEPPLAPNVTPKSVTEMKAGLQTDSVMIVDFSCSAVLINILTG
jgi:hypothetical protein